MRWRSSLGRKRMFTCFVFLEPMEYVWWLQMSFSPSGHRDGGKRRAEEQKEKKIRDWEVGEPPPHFCYALAIDCMTTWQTSMECEEP